MSDTCCASLGVWGVSAVGLWSQDFGGVSGRVWRTCTSVIRARERGGFELTEKENEKPLYDARQQYYQVMLSRFDKARDLSIVREHAMWLGQLRQIFNMMSAWITEGQKKELKEDMTLARQKLQNIHSLPQTSWGGQARNDYTRELEELLYDIDEKLLVYGKHLMLPSAHGDDDEIDMETFMRQSGV